MANAEVQNKIANDPTMSKGDIKKARQQSLSKYRAEVGSVSRRDRSIQITDREWDAIQAGAISENTLTKILANADVDKLRERAMPRATTTLSTAKVNRIKAMSNSNYSLTEIAKALGVSTSTVSNYLKGAN
jgi:DNA-binding transcriptional regulator YiaG